MMLLLFLLQVLQILSSNGLYELVTTGNCKVHHSSAANPTHLPIGSVEECKAAAAVLGLEFSTIKLDWQESSADPSPPFCYIKSGELRFNYGSYTSYNGNCDDVEGCLCRVEAKTEYYKTTEGNCAIPITTNKYECAYAYSLVEDAPFVYAGDNMYAETNPGGYPPYCYRWNVLQGWTYYDSPESFGVCKSNMPCYCRAAFEGEECEYNGATVLHGHSIQRDLFEAEWAISCTPAAVQTGTCFDGHLQWEDQATSPPLEYYTCSEYADCDHLGVQDLLHGSTATRERWEYQEAIAPESCQSEIQTGSCFNGTITWTGTFDELSCSLYCDNEGWLQLSDEPFIRTRWQEAFVHLPAVCSFEVQTGYCDTTTGEIDWEDVNYHEETCTEFTPCSGGLLNEQTTTRVRFTEPSVPLPQQCESETQVGTCDGTTGEMIWDASELYVHEDCYTTCSDGIVVQDSTLPFSRVRFQDAFVIPPYSCLEEVQTGHCESTGDITWTGSFTEENCEHVWPSKSPSAEPSTSLPTFAPSFVPSKSPTFDQPSMLPSISPTSESPSASPSHVPSISPTSESPSASPSQIPSFIPSQHPIIEPSVSPSRAPSRRPTTDQPSVSPSFTPSRRPTTNQPSANPTIIHSISPSHQTPTIAEENSAVQGTNVSIIIDYRFFVFLVVLPLGILVSVVLCVVYNKNKLFEQSEHDLEAGSPKLEEGEGRITSAHESMTKGGSCFSSNPRTDDEEIIWRTWSEELNL